MSHLSPNYLMYYSNYILGDDPDDDNGGTLFSCARAMKGKGLCRESLWPQCCKRLSTSGLKLADRDAYYKRIAFYQRCYNIKYIKYSLSNFSHPVILNFNVYPSITKAEKYGVIPLPNKSEKSTGMHSVIVIEYNDNLELSDENGNLNKGYFTFVNSWGKDWGDSGKGYLPYSYWNDVFESGTITNYSQNINYKEFKVNYSNDFLLIGRGLSQGLTLTHNLIMFSDLYDKNHTLLGWIITSKTELDTVEIIDFFIWPEYRFQGYGQVLMNETIKYLKYNNIKYIYLWFNREDSWQDSWLIATKFFKKNRFDCSQKKDTFPWATGIIDLSMY